MPAPAVYVLAVLGTVGVAIAFKEFVYEPHIAPAIDRWKIEYQAARRRRQTQQTRAAVVRNDDSETDFLMSESGNGSNLPNGRRFVDREEDGYVSEDNRPLAGLGSNRSLRNGLLLRRTERERDSNSRTYLDSVELDDLVAPELSEWRNEATGQVLRQRKNVSEHTSVEESNRLIPFVPLSPSKTHVVFDYSEPSTSENGSRLATPPTRTRTPIEPTAVIASAVSTAGKVFNASSSSQNVVNELSTLPNASPHPPQFPATPPMTETFGPSLHSPPPAHIPTPPHPPHSTSTTTSIVPSLSQSYPQDLDYEHGLELLSPPSSRSISPFSMAGMGLNPLVSSRANSNLPSRSQSVMSSFSSASDATSPISPVEMRLGNESFDTLSPAVQTRQLEPSYQQPSVSLSPFADHAPSLHQQAPQSNFSATNSIRSTPYLSFEEIEHPLDNNNSASSFRSNNVQAQLSANLGASVGGEGLSRSFSLSASTSSSTSGSDPNSTFLSPSGSLVVPAPSLSQSPGLGLTLFPVQPRNPITPPTTGGTSVHPTVNGFVPIGHGAGDPSYFRHSNSNSEPAHPSFSSPPPRSPPYSPSRSARSSGDGQRQVATPSIQSDSELSDLDFLSDINEHDLDIESMGSASESESGWSMTGGSESGADPTSPRIPSTRPLNADRLGQGQHRGGTIWPRGNSTREARERQGNNEFGFGPR